MRVGRDLIQGPSDTVAPQRPQPRRGRVRIAGRGRGAVILVAIAGLTAAPLALASGSGGGPGAERAQLAAAGGLPIRGGIKNPPRGGYFSTTQIWGNNSSWGTRQSNLGTGGSAIYGCRAPAGGVPCLDADNLRGGQAFSFITTGAIGGSILVGNVNGAPFRTNGHGVATGLNANFLQGKQASDFQLASQPAANASQLGGQPPSFYLNNGQLLFANVGSGPVLSGGRGATAVKQSGTTYTVTFGSANVSKCAYTASPQGAALSGGQLGVAPSSTSTSAVTVDAPSGFSGGFYLQVAC